jgi:hypothetical protein
VPAVPNGSRNVNVSDSQQPVDRADSESVGQGLTTSTISPDPPDREQYGSTLAPEGSILHGDFLDSSWAQRDMVNSVLPTPDWSSGFGFSIS